jgi:hypothetical protein
MAVQETTTASDEGLPKPDGAYSKTDTTAVHNKCLCNMYTHTHIHKLDIYNSTMYIYLYVHITRQTLLLCTTNAHVIYMYTQT